MSANNINKVLSWDGIKDVLTLLVIPALLWVSSVSTTLEVTKLKNEAHSESLTKVQNKIDEQTQRAHDTSERLVRLETRIDAIGVRISEIRDILVSFNNPNRPK